VCVWGGCASEINFARSSQDREARTKESERFKHDETVP
jgi:hypothetical protein